MKVCTVFKESSIFGHILSIFALRNVWTRPKKANVKYILIPTN
jgi:hypothetical protein